LFANSSLSGSSDSSVAYPSNWSWSSGLAQKLDEQLQREKSELQAQIEKIEQEQKRREQMKQSSSSFGDMQMSREGRALSSTLQQLAPEMMYADSAALLFQNMFWIPRSLSNIQELARLSERLETCEGKLDGAEISGGEARMLSLWVAALIQASSRK
jgi:hypothetical protein